MRPCFAARPPAAASIRALFVVACASAVALAPRAARAQDLVVPPLTASTSPAVAATTQVPAAVWVSLEGTSDQGRLEVLDPRAPATSDDTAWSPLCAHPCGRWIAPGSRLRVSGDFASSAPFVVTTGGPLVVAARPGNTALRWTGGAVGVTGAVVVTGALLVALLAEFSGPGGRTPTDEERLDNQRNRRTALVVAGVSTIPTALGFVAFALAGRTNVSFRSPSVGSARAPFAPIALGRGVTLSPSGVQF